MLDNNNDGIITSVKDFFEKNAAIPVFIVTGKKSMSAIA